MLKEKPIMESLGIYSMSFSQAKSGVVNCGWGKNGKNSAEDVCGFGLVRASIALPFFIGSYVLGRIIPRDSGKADPPNP